MIGFLYKMGSLLVTRKIVDNTDIAASYDKVSNQYEKYFLHIMHRHNDKVLDMLVKEIKEEYEKNQSRRLKILDLACGTGYNTRYLMHQGVEADYTLVDLSEGMLNKCKESGMDITNVTFVKQDMLSYLKKCSNDTFDFIICMWAIKYQPPKKVIQECGRVIKNGGRMISIVNTADTLPQMRKLYPRLLVANWRSLKKIMFDLPNPKNKDVFARWFRNAGFSVKTVRSGRQTIKFRSTEKLVEFLTSTGALAGYDDMIDLRNPEIKMQMISYFKEKHVLEVEHRYVFGLFRKGDHL